MDESAAPEVLGEALSGSVEGILASIEAGLAHLTPEQRRDWESDAHPNLLISEGLKPESNLDG